MYCDCTIFQNSCPKISIAISFITNVIVGDSLNYHNNMAFTTQDQDDDRWSGENCATDWGSAGWFNICFKANPNGQYIDSEKTNDPKYLVWYHWKNSWVSLKSMKLMIRPRAWHQDLTGFFLWSPKLLFSYIRAEHELRFICETSSLQIVYTSCFFVHEHSDIFFFEITKHKMVYC